MVAEFLTRYREEWNHRLVPCVWRSVESFEFTLALEPKGQSENTSAYLLRIYSRICTAVFWLGLGNRLTLERRPYCLLGIGLCWALVMPSCRCWYKVYIICSRTVRNTVLGLKSELVILVTVLPWSFVGLSSSLVPWIYNEYSVSTFEHDVQYLIMIIMGQIREK